MRNRISLAHSRDDPAAVIRHLKKGPGGDMLIFCSGSIVQPVHAGEGRLLSKNPSFNLQVQHSFAEAEVLRWQEVTGI
jgi:hypothetical protein